MRIFQTKQELKKHLSHIRTPLLKLGLVPTMGALHQGHITLIRKATNENNLTVVSIFVNPTQFNNKEDLIKYPKTLEEDMGLIKTVSEEIIVFAPSVAEIYADDVSSRAYDFNGLENVMEGAFRKGHFNGVGTIVEELLNIVAPTNAYFGEKDFQQLQIIKKMVRIRNIPTNIVGCPIVRENSGLAMSSRNERLSNDMRQKAATIYKVLLSAKQKFGTKSATYVADWVSKEFANLPELKLEYFEITDDENLRPVQRKNKHKNYRAFIAVYIEGIRLIDNIALN